MNSFHVRGKLASTFHVTRVAAALMPFHGSAISHFQPSRRDKSSTRISLSLARARVPFIDPGRINDLAALVVPRAFCATENRVWRAISRYPAMLPRSFPPIPSLSRVRNFGKNDSHFAGPSFPRRARVRLFRFRGATRSCTRDVRFARGEDAL